MACFPLLLSAVACSITPALAGDALQKDATTTCKAIDDKISKASDVIYPSESEEKALRRHTPSSEY